jgi:hypothetical protein
MNRKLKFRVWDKHLGIFYENVDFLTEGTWSRGGEPILQCTLDAGEYWDCEEEFSENFILQQYTEMTDRRGHKIYEGDIVAE